tara:strand:- start:2124 stop:6614 length:4491 start_codon:yes stop_codon:yes gene_type:complete
MAKITKFKEPLKFQPLEYRGLDTIPVFIEDGSPDSYDYFGITRVPRELTAGRNLISFTGTQNLVPGSEIAIEVLDSNGNTVPTRTYDYIGEGSERIFAIEIGKEIPEGDAKITVLGVAKGKVGFDTDRQQDISELPPPRYRGTFNLRWTKRLNCYPRRRNTDEILYFENPDITIEEIKRPYFQLHYNTELTGSNSRSLFSLCSTGSEGFANTTATVRYESAGNKYFLVSSEAPDFGGFTNDMAGGTIFIPTPSNPFPSAFNSPVGTPIYNELETGDGTGIIDENTQLYTNQGAFNTIVSEVVSPLRLRVNSPHTTFQGIGRANQKEVFHSRFDASDFRLDFAQSPVSRSNPLASGSNAFATSYAKVSFNGLTPLVGDVTRVKTFIRNDQTATDYFLVGDNPVFSQNLLVQSESLVTRHSAGDFSQFGVSESVDTYWSASSTDGLGFTNNELQVFRQLVGNINNPIPDSIQIGDSVQTHQVGLLDGTNHILLDSTIDIEHRKDKYYQVEFKCFGKKVNENTPYLKIYMLGPAINAGGDDLGQLIGEITDIENQELVVDQDPLNEYETTSLRFTYKADATEFAKLRFKIEQGLWYIFDIEVKPYYEHGYTPHFFDAIIPTTKANVGQVDALDFRFEFYNDEHNKAVFTADIPNIEFDNEFTFTATNAYFTSASIGTFIGATPMGDDDWVKPFLTIGAQAQYQPSNTGSIYHSGSVGIGNFGNANVEFPLHVNKLEDEGNATIKLQSYSSSILHLASDTNGAGLANQKNAMVIFDHNNATTSSIIGYTDTVNVDPGGAAFDGAPAGSFTIHERNANAIAIGVGGHVGLQVAYDGKLRSAANSVYIGYDDVTAGPFNPYHFGFELNVSGSLMVSSGSIYYPQAPGADAGADPQMIVVENNLGRLVSMSFRESATALGLGADRDWFIGTTYISQSRDTTTSEGRTVWVGDSADSNDSLSTSTHIFQLSQSGTSPISKIRIEGLNDAVGAGDNNFVLVVNANGDLLKTGSYGVGGSGGSGDIESVVAGVGLSGGATTGDATLTVDFSEFSTVVPTTGDFLATLDSDGATEQKTTTDALATLFSGNGLTATNAVIEVDINALTAASIASGDSIAFSDEGTAGDPTKKESIDDVATLFSGNGLTATNAVIEVDINALTAGGIASGDFIAFSDEGTAGDPTKKESIDDVAELFADGTTITAASAVLSVAGIPVVDDSADADHYVIFADTATGVIAPKTNTGITYNPSHNRVVLGQITASSGISASGDVHTGENLYVGSVHNRIHLYQDPGGNEVDLYISASDNDLKLMAADDISLRPKNDLKITTGAANDEGIIHKDFTDILLFESYGEQSSTGVGKFILHSKLHNPGMDSTAGTYYMRYNTTTNLVSYITSNSESKANITHISDSLGNAILDLKPVTFNYRNEPLTSVGGFIAEEAAEANTHFATYGPNYKWTNEGHIATVSGSTEKILKDDRIVPVDIQDRAILAGLVAKVQDLEARIKELEG